MNWYKVEINGRYNGKPLAIQRALRANDERDAAYAAVWEEFDAGGVEEIYHGVGQDGKIYFDRENGYYTPYRTNHASFEEMAVEITAAAELAHLNGDPMLPLEME